MGIQSTVIFSRIISCLGASGENAAQQVANTRIIA